jgi:formylglycine-generating enzyme required for sulfatase activity
MGSPTSEEDRDNDETQHPVTITRGYCMKATEVTQSEWQAVMGINPSYFKDCGANCPDGHVRIAPGAMIARAYCKKATDVTQAEWRAVVGVTPSSFENAGANCPVEQVSWDDAVGYANALSRRDGLPECYAGSTFTGLGCRGYRLPTEAEWEYAARAGTTGATYGKLGSSAWYYMNARETTHEVRQKQPNAWGLYDMLGNVWEWTGDSYAPYTGSVTDPTGHARGFYRAFRGGSWHIDVRNARAADRDRHTPDYHYTHLGFRLVRTAP